MKIAYIVRGSEDGNLGVYTNKKKAYESALSYFRDDQKDNNLSLFDYNTMKDVTFTYANVCKVLRNYTTVTIEAYDRVTVEIQAFEINKI